MGRVKLKIKKLESSGNRQVTYSKRRNGILKKAKELSILCDVDITLLMFSPTGRPTLFQGERSNFEDIIAKFGHLTPQERAKRKLESLEVLKKTFKKLDHDVNVQEFVGSSTQTVENLTNHARVLQTQLTELHKRLSFWSNPEKVDDVEQLRQMEDMLKESISRTRLHKENFEKHQLASLNCTGQFQNGMPSSLIVGSVHETQPMPWILNNDNQHLILPNEVSFLPHRDIDCSTNASVARFNSYFGSGASTSTSTGKQSEVGDPGQLDNMGHIPSMEGGCGLNEYDINACLSTELGQQYAYPSYCNPNVPDDKKLKPGLEMNLPTNSVDYQASSNFELPRSLYGDEHPSWLSSSGPSTIAVYDQNTYQQQPNMRL
ncbi:agamous-like MADS-box protein AGL65 [Rosa sericea]